MDNAEGMGLEDAGDAGMNILSNEQKMNGATALLDSKMMDEISERMGGDFYILPSSLHEVIILPVRDDFNIKDLEAMVQDVNATQVSNEDQLSDHVYAYDSVEKEIVRAEVLEDRRLNLDSKETVADLPKTQVMKENAKAAESKERPSLKTRLNEKKEVVAKNDKERTPDLTKNIGRDKDASL